ncbi:hypothetical protein N7470_003539 [Penicillium chermesinum]|nr:hypothetical protein N7470_003539 [Penicillium chermesinum]
MSSSSAAGTPIVFEPVARIYHSAEKGDFEFQGYSADRTFIQGFKDEFAGWEFDTAHKKLPNLFSVTGLFDTSSGTLIGDELPERALAVRLTEAALDAQVMFSVIHRPSFNISFNLIYMLDQQHYSVLEWRFLALFYAVLAYGRLHADIRKDDSSEILSEAASYYEKSRRLQDFAECKDIVSLQAIFFKILFHLVVTRVFTSYTYSSAALSVAIRMGLHKPLGNQHDFVSREMGKRLFRGLWVLSNDVAASCGLPRLLSSSEIPNEPFLEVNDSYFDRTRMGKQPQDELCLVAAANVYQSLQPIFHRITDLMYSEKRFQVSAPAQSMRYTIDIETLQILEAELGKWLNNIPTAFRLGKSFGNRQLLTAQFNVCISYAHSQIYLYRPFLQHFTKCSNTHISPESSQVPWLAAICIQACENVVMLCEDMYRRELLTGGNWIVSRALFSSSLTLFYAVLASTGSRQMDSLSGCLAMARKISDRLATRNVPAHRWKVMLTIMIATLPPSAKHIQERLMEYDSKMSSLCFYDTEQTVPDDTYTASLGEQALSFLSSQSPDSIKSQGLPPRRLAALRFGCIPESIMTPTLARPPSRMDLNAAQSMRQEYGSPSQLYINEEAKADFGNEICGTPDERNCFDLQFNPESVDFGNMDDFLDLQSWL